MKRLLSALLALVICTVPALAWKKHGSSSTPWQMMKIFATGHTLQAQMGADNTLYTTIDVANAYALRASNSLNNWVNVINNTSLATFLNTGNNGGAPIVAGWNGAPQGVIQLVPAPSNPNHLYMLFQLGMWYSLDHATTWNLSAPKTGYPIVSTNAVSNTSPYNKWQSKLIVDPVNENIAYLGTPNRMLMRTTDGGVTWLPVISASSPMPSVAKTVGLGGITAGSSTTFFMNNCNNVLPGMFIYNTTSNLPIGAVTTCNGSTNLVTISFAAQNNGVNTDALAIIQNATLRTQTTTTSATVTQGTGNSVTGCGATCGQVTVASCTGITAGWYVKDVTNGLYLGNVFSCSAGTLTVTAAWTNSAGSGDALNFYDNTATSVGAGIFGMAFDTSGGTASGASCPNSVSPCTKNIYVVPYVLGASIPYFSSDAGTTWAQVATTGSPPGFTISQAGVTTDGRYFCFDTDGATNPNAPSFKNIHMYSGGLAGTWTTTATTPPEGAGTGPRAFAFDPRTSGASTRVVIFGSNGSQNSTTDGSTWQGWSANTLSGNISWPESPWAQAAVGTSIGIAAAVYDLVTANKVWVCGAGTCFNTIIPTNTLASAPAYTAKDANMGQAVSLSAVKPPGSPYLITTAEDKWIFTIPAANTGLGTFPAGTIGNITPTLVGTCWGIDYASKNPNYSFCPLLGNAGSAPTSTTSDFPWTSDYGATWHTLRVGTATSLNPCDGTTNVQMPPEQLTTGGQPYNNPGAQVAASTNCNIIFATATRQPFYTLDGGNTWARTNLLTASGGKIQDTVWFQPNAAGGWSNGAISVNLPATDSDGNPLSCSNFIIAVPANTEVIAVDTGNGQVATVHDCTSGVLTFNAGISGAGGAGAHLVVTQWVLNDLNCIGQFTACSMWAADRVTPNTFYTYWGTSQSSTSGHAEYGLYRSCDGGATFVQLSNNVFNTSDKGIVAVPGKPGQLWEFPQITGSQSAINFGTAPATHPNTGQKVYFFDDSGNTTGAAGSCNGSGPSGQTVAAVPGVVDGWALCFGAPAAGASYPAVYWLGFGSATGSAPYTWGLWRSTNFDPANVAGTSWTMIDTAGGGYPFGGLGAGGSCVADQNVYGSIYVTQSNYNWQWGVFP